ncbi:pentapeptide repeat-containing protein [Flavisolibacter nicotianae]|uniref:pentapeptide repeat-containing protein n=1 Tax=Flavisolibacter nicotianae TaxID=2364882 RepID=UPI000EADF24D|nr:pentapeptide repeat-containing protein [Flavisolibacter nicotianae]
MSDVFETDKTFDGVDFSQTFFRKGEYDGCNFINCDFSHTDLSSTQFIDCSFMACNLSLAKLAKTTLQDIHFKNCKLLGLRFDECSGFGLAVKFENCQLNHACFAGTKLKGTLFTNTQLQEVDFTDSDLTGASFHHCDLKNAVFENTLLQKADFRTASNYAIDPEINRVKGAKFSLPDVLALLDKYGIQVDPGAH